MAVMRRIVRSHLSYEEAVNAQQKKGADAPL